MARPLKLTAEAKEKFLEFLRAGNTITAAAWNVGVDYDTVLVHRHKSPKFNEQVRRALRHQIQVLDDAAYQSAIGGNATMQIFLLVNRTRQFGLPPEERYYNTQQVQVGVDPDGPPIRLWESLRADPELRDLFAKASERIVDIGQAGLNGAGHPGVQNGTAGG